MEDRRTRLPTEREIAEINARHLISTPIKPADLLFVFGTREDVARRVDEAYRLWREGFFRWSIVSGGVTPGSKLSECEIIKTAMVGQGIPPECILEEHPRDQHRRKRHLLAADHRGRARAREYPQRDLPRQHLDGAPLPDDVASILA